MKLNLFLFLFIAGFSLANAQKDSEAFIGKWLDHTKEAAVEIYENEGKYYGIIIWLKEPNDKKGNPKKDVKNSDSKLRKNELMGLQVLSGLEFNDEKWKNGKMYSIKKGRTGNCSVYLESTEAINIEISTPFGIKTIKWTKL